MGVDIKRYICSGLFGATVLVPNRNEPRSEGLATAGLPNVNDCDPRVLAEPSIDLVLEGAGILIAVHHRSVLPEELHLHQKTPLPPNEQVHLHRPREEATNSEKPISRPVPGAAP